ncbi:MAG: phage holin family protein [Streptococcaceae bacterium]|nr:phage holin family protein [Streptococcaceae bacterium]MCH4178097.1 phage holin family protein [Streptococcaceae bacterium]
MMERIKGILMKDFNSLSISISTIGGFCIGFLGGMDNLLHALLFMIVLDFLTGLVKSIVNKRLSSQVGAIGIAKKVMTLLIVAVAVEVEMLIGQAIPLREIVILFYLSNEGISLLENVSEFLPIPDKLKEYFLQLRDKDKE